MAIAFEMMAATIAYLAIMEGLQLQWLASEGSLDMAGDFEAYVEHLKLTWQIGAES